MSYYEQIYDEAIGNNGLITTRQAAELGIPAVELVKLCHRGKLTRIGHGAYRIDKYFPQETDSFAAAIAPLHWNSQRSGLFDNVTFPYFASYPSDTNAFVTSSDIKSMSFFMSFLLISMYLSAAVISLQPHKIQVSF